MEEMNHAPSQKRVGSRYSVFTQDEQPLLRPPAKDSIPTGRVAGGKSSTKLSRSNRKKLLFNAF